MKNIFSKVALAAAIVFFSASMLSATPIYMQYEGVQGEVIKAEVVKGKAVAKGLKAGTYKVQVIYTGPDALDENGAPKTRGHVKVFDGKLSYSHLNKTRQGKASMQDIHFTLKTSDGKSSSAVGTGKVSLQDFHFVIAPIDNRGELMGNLGTLTIENKSTDTGKSTADSTTTSTDKRSNWLLLYDFTTPTL